MPVGGQPCWLAHERSEGDAEHGRVPKPRDGRVAFRSCVGLVGNRNRAYCHVGKHCMRCELAMRLTLHSTRRAPQERLPATTNVKEYGSRSRAHLPMVKNISWRQLDCRFDLRVIAKECPQLRCQALLGTVVRNRAPLPSKPSSVA